MAEEGEGDDVVEDEARKALGLGEAPWDKEDEGVSERLVEGDTLEVAVFHLEILAGTVAPWLENLDSA